ncbi:hypothetical protein BJY01DRAFT_252212 [Aspergillus pseudoustus]|uniref:Uncharacterized protein n=1 Tax=Aspergillus pseudoustus TaxID=1810923 RepID=A0ABR4J7D1_9EURO
MGLSNEPLTFKYSRIDPPPQQPAQPAAKPESKHRSVRLVKKVHARIRRRGLEEPQPPTPSPPSGELFRLLSEFLSSKTNPMSIALDDIFNVFRRPGVVAYLGNDPKDRRLSCAAVILHVAGQIPYNHLGHIRLARLAHELSGFDMFPKRREWEQDDNFGRLRDPEDPTELDCRRADGVMTSNLHAFYARMAAYSNPDSPPIFIIMALRALLEMTLTFSIDRIPDEDVIAAAQYILYNGQALYNKVDVPFAYSEAESVLVSGTRLQRRQGLPLERWQYWLKTFQAVQHSGNYGLPATDVAGRVANIMLFFEKNLELQAEVHSSSSDSAGRRDSAVPSSTSSGSETRKPKD